MAEFAVPDLDSFEPADAIIRMLKLLDALFDEIAQDRRLLFPPQFEGAAFSDARGQARQQIYELIEAVRLFTRIASNEPRLRDYGLTDQALRFKLQVIEFTNNQIPRARQDTLRRITNGRTPGRWNLYGRAMRGTLAAIDGPLESLTKMLGIGEGVVEFKKGLEVLLNL